VINDTYKGINTLFIALFADLEIMQILSAITRLNWIEIPSSTVMDPGFSQLAVLWEREKTQSIDFGFSVVAPKQSVD
jgi:hypothetical protein